MTPWPWPITELKVLILEQFQTQDIYTVYIFPLVRTKIPSKIKISLFRVFWAVNLCNFVSFGNLAPLEAVFADRGEVIGVPAFPCQKPKLRSEAKLNPVSKQTPPPQAISLSKAEQDNKLSWIMRYLGNIQSKHHIEKHHKENILHQLSSLLSRRTLELSAPNWIWKFDKVSFPRNACCFLVRWIYLVMLFPRISLFLSSYLVWFDNLSPISNLIKNQWNKYTSNGHHHIGQSRWSFISEDGKIDTDPQTFEIEF